MANPHSGGNQDQSKQIRLPGVPKRFDREGAAKFLKSSPRYVTQHAAWLEKHAPHAFKDAGFRLAKRGGKIVLEKWTGETRKAGGMGRGAGALPIRIYEPVTNYTSTQLKNTSGRQGSTPDLSAPKTTKTNPAPTAAPSGGGGGGGAGRETAGTSGGGPLVDLSGLEALNPAVGKMIDPALANAGAKLYGPGVAEAQAGIQYDGMIQDLQRLQTQAPRDTDQHKKDIGSWYGQVLNSLRTAAGRDKAAGEAGVKSTQDATAAILSSIGGAANEGAGMVGAAGADAVGTQQAMATAQDQYNTDLAPLFELEKAGALGRVAAQGTSQLQELAAKLAQARGQRGQAVVANQANIDQANNGILDSRAGRRIDIEQANNQLAQQQYANRFGMETAKLSAAVSGAEVIAKAAGDSPKDWSQLSPAARNAALKTVWTSVMGARGNPVAGKTETLKRAGQVAVSMGYDPNAVIAVVGNTLRSQHPGWWRTSK